MIHLTTTSAEETHELGRWLGSRLVPGSVVGLDGDLGAGKTWMVKGIVQGLGECDEALVKSPAFNLVHEYEVVQSDGCLAVVHLDFYRLDHLTDTDFLLFSEYFERHDAVVLVEWAHRFLPELVACYLSVALSVDDPESRTVAVEAVGGGYEALMAELEEHADAHR